MSDTTAIRAAIIGLGFMGRIHLAAYQAARGDGFACQLVAVCDQDADRRAGLVPVEGNLPGDRGAEGARLFDPATVRGHARPEDLLADDEVDLVSICTHTDTHADLAILALEAGKHVLVEKPVAILTSDVERVARAAAAAPGRICMPAMCMRFWPGWDWLRDRIRDRSFGPVLSATFQRLGSLPDWSRQFYGDRSKSGGALADLHIHDADFVYHCFGDPDEVSSTGSIEHLTALYQYEHGPEHVAAEGGWDQAPGFPFRMRYLVNFAEATADYDLGRKHPLLLARNGSCRPVPLSVLTGYDGEIRHLLESISEGAASAPLAPIEDALAVARLLEREREALGGPQSQYGVV